MLEIQGLGLARSSRQLLMVRPGAGPPVVLNSEASPSLRPKAVSFNKSNCQAGLALEEETDLFWWKSERLPGFCTKLNLWRQVTDICECTPSWAADFLVRQESGVQTPLVQSGRPWAHSRGIGTESESGKQCVNVGRSLGGTGPPEKTLWACYRGRKTGTGTGQAEELKPCRKVAFPHLTPVHPPAGHP